MNILYIGAGFVGSCSAGVMADSGHRVLVYDIDKNKIDLLNSGDRDVIQSCLFEEGLGEILVRNKERIKFAFVYQEVEAFVEKCDAVFMCLPTPEIGETGESNLSYYFDAAETLAMTLAKRNGGVQEKYIVVINKSTVPIDMVDKTRDIFASRGVKNFGVISNPEFLVEGKAIQGSLKPDRIVIGAESEKDFALMRKLYQRFSDSAEIKYIEVNPREAAAGKLLANFVLFNKLAVCYDVIGRTSESFAGLSFENLRKILASDERIGGWGLFDSLFAGGSCFIKDSRSLAHQLQTAGQNTDLIKDTQMANKRQLKLFLDRAEKEVGFVWENKKVAVVGLSFKRGTNDIRNSPSIEIVNFLRDKKTGEIFLFDYAAMDNFSKLFPADNRLQYTKNAREAIEVVDVVIIASDWPQFRGLAEEVLLELKKRPLIMDGRRMLQHKYRELRDAGFDIIAVGSPFYKKISKSEYQISNKI